MKDLIIHHATHGNLKDISLTVPKNQLVVVTGLSGSGKSTLMIDVLYQECQRQYLEAISFQGINKPNVELIENVSAAIVISQDEKNNNIRSTLGTITNIYTDLRMIYEKMGKRVCPHCQQIIDASHCREEFIKKGTDYEVYMYCSQCGKRMEKLTRSHFSFNTKEGACPTCSGLGEILKINESVVIDEDLSLNDGAIDFWVHRYKDYQIELLEKAFQSLSLSLDIHKPLKQWSQKEKSILLFGIKSHEFQDVQVKDFEGVYQNLFRRMEEKEGQSESLKKYFHNVQCPDCHGERLNKLSREVTVQNTKITELSMLSLKELFQWLCELEEHLDNPQKEVIEQYIIDLKTKLKRIMNVGLGYLHLDRQTMTLSGGEKQRIKLAATLDSQMTGVIYILDEPTVGLHPVDTQGMIEILRELRDKENTVIVIEHDEDIIKVADFIIDIGPHAGVYGGEIVVAGSYQDVLNHPHSLTGQYLNRIHTLEYKPRQVKEFLEIQHGTIHNIKDIDARFGLGCFNVVTGVSGSGKSSLVFGVLEKQNHQALESCFDKVITVRQTTLSTMKRSTVATYSGVYDEIRKLFARQSQNLTIKDFSFNSKGGRCERCEGLGTVNSNMLFFKDIDIVCPVCGGKRFMPHILEVEYHGYSIYDVLCLSIDEAIDKFIEEKKIIKRLKMLKDIGLGYLKLGQVLTTLSGGEKQRLKLAVELLDNVGKHNVYLIDEPTVGLHPIDIDNLLILFHRIVDMGNTLIVIEHNLQVIQQADYMIDMGPGGGKDGGQIVAEGTIEQVLSNPHSSTGKYLSLYLANT